jgi:hypothetical protein
MAFICFPDLRHFLFTLLPPAKNFAGLLFYMSYVPKAERYSKKIAPWIDSIKPADKEKRRLALMG